MNYLLKVKSRKFTVIWVYRAVLPLMFPLPPLSQRSKWFSKLILPKKRVKFIIIIALGTNYCMVNRKKTKCSEFTFNKNMLRIIFIYQNTTFKKNNRKSGVHVSLHIEPTLVFYNSIITTATKVFLLHLGNLINSKIENTEKFITLRSDAAYESSLANLISIQFPQILQIPEHINWLKFNVVLDFLI